MLRLPWKRIQNRRVLHKARKPVPVTAVQKQHSKKLQRGWTEHKQVNGSRCWFSPMLHSTRPYQSLLREIFPVKYLFLKSQF